MTLQSLEEANKEAHIRAQLKHEGKTGIACPSCGCELYEPDNTILLSSPPQKIVKCRCGYSGTRIVA